MPQANGKDIKRETEIIFSLPSQTGILFTLLVLAVIAAVFIDPINPTTEFSISYLVHDALKTSSLPQLEWGFLSTGAAVMWGLAALGFALKFFLLPLVLSLTAVFVFTKPGHLYRKYSMQDLASRYSELAVRFKGLAQEMGIARTPELLWSPSQSREAFVFGAFGNPSVCLTEGMLRHFRDRPAEMEAVMTHELGHIANRDVARTELAEAAVRGYFWLWLSIFALQALGFIATPLLPSRQAITWDYSFLVSFTYVAVLYVLMNALSQVRQSYADVRAINIGNEAALDRNSTLDIFSEISINHGSRSMQQDLFRQSAGQLGFQGQRGIGFRHRQPYQLS